MKKREKSPVFLPLDPEIVVKAIFGDEDAIGKIVSYYQPIIIQKAVRLCIDDTGRRSFYIDPFVSGQMEGQLIRAILTFRRHL